MGPGGVPPVLVAPAAAACASAEVVAVSLGVALLVAEAVGVPAPAVVGWIDVGVLLPPHPDDIGGLVMEKLLFASLYTGSP